ncbi:CocE/NonD family hydrolase [Povalibacter sp.]|uniref:CocE/NonD family hydrolase n=1 Tax=Povalibacter sp. TaxID=1962978 RepID=UPI002F3FDDAD
MANSAAYSASPPRLSSPGQYEGYSAARYDGHHLTSQYVAVRDGTRLAVDIFRPTANGVVATDKLPVLWMHTPYERRTTRDGLTAANYPGKALELLPYGYIVAVVDFRGLYASFGHNAGFNRGEWQDAAKMDAYDITEWLAAQPWSSGKIGMWGCSATGGSQMQALTTAPPSLRAIFPMSCEWDVYPFASAGGMSPPSGVPTQIMRGGSRVERDKSAVPVDGDDNRALLDAAIAEHANNLETAGYTPFRDSRAEYFDNQWWLKSSPHTYLETINRSGIALYVTANWDEGTTKYGAPFTFNNVTNPRKLIFGPATHCDWTTVKKETGFDIVVEERRFFDHWLKGIDNGVMREAAVTYYTYNEAPERQWKTSGSWPLRNERRTDFYLQPDALSQKPAAAAKQERVVDYGVTANNFWEKGLQFVTEPLATDVEVTGHPTLTLWLASSMTDADIVVRMDDVSPDGSAKYYNVEGKLRASLRKIEKPPYDNLGLPWHPYTAASVSPLTPGEPVRMELDLYPISYLFKAGQRIRLTINFADERATPRIVPAPRVTVFTGAEHASVLSLPIIPR